MKNNEYYIRMTRHYFHEPNKGKNENKNTLIKDFITVVEFYIDYLFNNEITYNNKIFNIKKDLLDCPRFISTKDIIIPNINSSQRLIRCASNQACGIVKSATEG